MIELEGTKGLACTLYRAYKQSAGTGARIIMSCAKG